MRRLIQHQRYRPGLKESRQACDPDQVSQCLSDDPEHTCRRYSLGRRLRRGRFLRGRARGISDVCDRAAIRLPEGGIARLVENDPESFKRLESAIASAPGLESLADKPWLKRGKFSECPDALLARPILRSFGRVATFASVDPCALKGISLETPERAANAMDCRLVYALVPHEPLDEIVDKRARALARKHLRATSHSMALGRLISHERQEYRR
jgi:hypothetical protein